MGEVLSCGVRMKTVDARTRTDPLADQGVPNNKKKTTLCYMQARAERMARQKYGIKLRHRPAPPYILRPHSAKLSVQRFAAVAIRKNVGLQRLRASFIASQTLVTLS